jgi:hypothetical protein
MEETKENEEIIVLSAEEQAEEAKSLRSQLEEGGAQRDAAIVKLRGNIVRLSFTRSGCHVVQMVFECLPVKVAKKLAEELKGHVLDAIQNENANHVIQKIVEKLPPAKAIFVTEELRGHERDVACHKFGCRVFQRMVEHASPEYAPLLSVLLGDVRELSLKEYGKHVVINLIEQSTDQASRRQIANTLCNCCGMLVQSRHGREVLAAALDDKLGCDEIDRVTLAWALFQEQHHVLAMARGKNGRLLVAAAVELDVCSGWKDHVRNQLIAAVPLLAKEHAKQGQRALQAAGLQEPLETWRGTPIFHFMKGQ